MCGLYVQINVLQFLQCLREASLPSEIFITTLRLTDNCDELKATKGLVSKEIQVLVSTLFKLVCYLL